MVTRTTRGKPADRNKGLWAFTTLSLLEPTQSGRGIMTGPRLACLEFRDVFGLSFTTVSCDGCLAPAGQREDSTVHAACPCPFDTVALEKEVLESKKQLAMP